MSSLDHIGPFARTVSDLAAAYDTMQGHDPADPVSTTHPSEIIERVRLQGVDGLRIATASGYFVDPEAADANEAVARVRAVLGISREIELPDPARARAAAFVITASEGGQHHLNDLRVQPEKFDPNTRTRLIAGALIPSAWVQHAQRFRTWYREQMSRVFEGVDVIVAPSTPCPAVRIGQTTIRWNGSDVPARANLGVYTQPISFVGLPVLNVPVHRPGHLPIGVQLIAAPYKEVSLFRVATLLERAGVTAAPVAVV